MGFGQILDRSCFLYKKLQVLAEIECCRCQVTDLTQLLTSHVLKIQNIGFF